MPGYFSAVKGTVIVDRDQFDSCQVKAAIFVHRIVILDEGRIVGIETPDEIKRNPVPREGSFLTASIDQMVDCHMSDFQKYRLKIVGLEIS